MTWWQYVIVGFFTFGVIAYHMPDPPDMFEVLIIIAIWPVILAVMAGHELSRRLDGK